MKETVDYWADRLPDYVPQATLERAELAAYLADQVADGESDLGVARVDLVGPGDQALELGAHHAP